MIVNALIRNKRVSMKISRANNEVSQEELLPVSKLARMVSTGAQQKRALVYYCCKPKGGWRL
uniref:Rap-GAP domain-containing protein n=1 Tax=Ascaris lumbricoides TaxID=6252 RepID=A0A0M3IF47_ASCLU